jgi:mono/diheme cytochrome c family protein
MNGAGWAVAGMLVLGAAGRAQAQQAVSGAQVYATRCASCHGAKGTPSPGMKHAMAALPDFATASATSLPDSLLREVILKGKGLMPAYGTRLKPEEVAALVAFVRSLGTH